MPSFDIVSEVNEHELTNAIDQANREVQTRFDFKDTDSSFEWKDQQIVLETASDFHLKQMEDVLRNKLAKRNIDTRSLEVGEPEVSNNRARQIIKVQQGIPTEKGKEITKLIKAKKLKVQASIQGDQVRVSGKKRDDLQAVIAMLKEEKSDLPLQFENFRD